MDIIERGEARFEDWAFENVRGNEMTCYCGKTCKLNDAETLSPDPYAIPVCPACFEDEMDNRYGPSWRKKMKKLESEGTVIKTKRKDKQL